MKKMLFVVVICLACTSFIHAQLGITFGGNISKYKYQSSSDRLFIFSWNGGLFYRIKSKTSNLVVQPALLYTGKGAEKFADIDINEPNEKYINHTNYVELSLPFIYSAPVDDNGVFRVDIGMGPFVANLVHATSTAVPYEGPRTTTDFKIGTAGTDDFKPLDAGLSFVAGIKLASLSMNIQYDLGLANTNPRSAETTLKSRAFMFNFFIYFGK